MYRRILVAVDDSDTSRLALRHAIALATAAGARLRLVHVVDELAVKLPPTRTLQDFWRAAREAGVRLLDGGQALAATAGIDAETKLLEIRTLGALVRRVRAAIVAESERWRADLLVIGTHGRRGLRKLVLGSVADGVVRTCGCPVLLVRPTARGGKRTRGRGARGGPARRLISRPSS